MKNDPTKKPHSGSHIEQQTLFHVYPQHKPLPVIICLLIISFSFIPIGAVAIVASDRITEIDVRYDQENNYQYIIGPAGANAVDFSFDGATYSTGKVAKKTIELKKSLSAPVFLQYRLKKVYQNYRWFGASLDTSQLKGGTGSLTDDCNPYRWPGEAQDGENQPGYYSPCGAIPWSMFNDTIAMHSEDTGLICNGAAFDADGNSLDPGNKCRKNGIAQPSDVRSSFKPPEPLKNEDGPMWKAGGDPSSSDPFLKGGYYYKEAGHTIPATTDQDFIVWANIAYLADFSNMYRIIETDLVAGAYFFNVVEQYDVFSFEGEKHIRLVTRNWLGGKNHVLGVLMLSMGCAAFVFALAVVILRVVAG